MVAIMAKAKGESTFTPVSEGLHQAICSAVVDLGMQPGSDMYPQPKRQVYLRFDCVDETVEFEKDGQKMTGPARCGATYTLSLGDKSKLRPLLESWRGKKFTAEELEGFDISKLLNVPCQIQILHNHKGGNTYANVQTIVPFPKNTPKPAPAPDAVIYSPSAPDKDAWDRLPQWLQKKIQERLGDTEDDLRKPKAAGAAPAAESDFDDDIPF
jgi:hypothetical protein